MNTESSRLRALLAAGAALVVFGITIPATAAPDGPGKPEVGSVGMADEKADPKGQSINNPSGDKNNGFRCDSNGGAGAGNPALGTCPPSTGETPPTGENPPKDPGPGDGSWYNGDN